MRLRNAVQPSILVGSLLTCAALLGGCGSDPSTGTDTAGTNSPPPDDSRLYPPSACQVEGPEVRVTQGGDIFTMSLVWAADHYLLSYIDRAVGSGDIFVQRLAADGTPEGAPAAVVSTPTASKSPRMSRLGSGDYLLTWEEGAAPAVISAMLLDANGAPKGPPTDIAASPSEEARPVVTTGPDGLILAWMEGEYPGSQAYVAKFDASGAFLPASKKSLGPGTGFPHVAAGPGGVGIVFSKSTPEEVATVEFGLLDASLSVTAQQSLRAPEGDARLARLYPRGSSFLAAWEDFRAGDEQVFMSIVDPAGSRSPDVLVENPGTGSANWPSVASKDDGSASAIVYYQFRQRRPQIFLAFIDPTGTKVGGDLQVSNTPLEASAKYPEIQWSGSNFGVTWIDTRDGAAQAYFASVVCPLDTLGPGLEEGVAKRARWLPPPEAGGSGRPLGPRGSGPVRRTKPAPSPGAGLPRASASGRARDAARGARALPPAGLCTPFPRAFVAPGFSRGRPAGLVWKHPLEVRGTASPLRAARNRPDPARQARPSLGPGSRGRRLPGEPARAARSARARPQ
ncbi:MAG TPA: hypothetical protein VFS43_13675, partial [Polyangiaceae bacterium]|nr:hypothetical protein [Polyangiaceae bacterium]